MSKKALLIGCGDLGLRCANWLLRNDFVVWGAKRSNNLPNSIRYLPVDVTNVAQVQSIANTEWDVVLITLTTRGESNYQRVYVDGVKNILDALQGKPLLLFASSTSVYGQNDGSYVDEASATQPKGFSGKTLLKAEALLRSAHLPAVSIRFSGIYGGGRFNHLIEQLRQGSICPKDPVHYSNRIHVDDAARFLCHLIEQHQKGHALEPVYLASDSEPPKLRDLMEWLARREGIAIDGLKEDYQPRRGGNRRYRNSKLLATGFKLNFPSFREGFN
jgi:nucleoside-diphosphate-sugar epimerase